MNELSIRSKGFALRNLFSDIFTCTILVLYVAGAYV